MFEKIEVLDKEKYKNMKYTPVEPKEVGRHIGLIPLGFTEVLNINNFAPILISKGGKDVSEFVVFTGLSEGLNIFNNQEVYIPYFLRSYPFLTTTIKDENDKLRKVIGIDKTTKVAKNRKIPIFQDIDGEITLSAESNEKITIAQDLRLKRDVSISIINTLIEKDMLIKKDFKITYQNETKVIIDEYYIVNKEKLINELDDETLLLWTKKGWISLIDAHLSSLSHFESIVNVKNIDRELIDKK